MSRHNEARRRRLGLFRWLVLGVVGIAMATPLVSLADFSIRFPLTGAISFDAWLSVLAFDQDTAQGQVLVAGLTSSAILAVLTVVLMLVLLLPTMVWVRLRAPRISRWVEFICLLPLTIPAIVLVVGLAPVYRVIANLVNSTDAVWLVFAYVVLVLPYAYRSLDAGLRAIDVRTLAEAAESFGSSWLGMLVRVILPNLRTALLSACFMTVAVVLGEFTIANLLARENLQTALFALNQDNPQFASVVALLCLIITAALLVGVSLFDRGVSRSLRRRAVPAAVIAPAVPGQFIKENNS